MKKKTKTVYGLRAKNFKELSHLWHTVVDQELQDREPELREISAREQRRKETNNRRDAVNNRER